MSWFSKSNVLLPQGQFLLTAFPVPCIGRIFLFQVKTESFANGFLKNHQTDQIMTILWERHSESSTRILLSGGCEVTDFHRKCGLFLKTNVMLESRGWDLSKLILQKLPLMKIQPFFFFFLNKLSKVLQKPLVKFQSSEQLHFDNFGYFSLFIEERSLLDHL